MSFETAKFLVIFGMALIVGIALWFNQRLLNRRYKSKIIKRGPHRYEVWFCYKCGCSEDYWWDWCQLYYREKPLKFSPTADRKFKAAIFKTYEEAEDVKLMYDVYIANHGSIEDD